MWEISLLRYTNTLQKEGKQKLIVRYLSWSLPKATDLIIVFAVYLEEYLATSTKANYSHLSIAYYYSLRLPCI